MRVRCLFSSRWLDVTLVSGWYIPTGIYRRRQGVELTVSFSSRTLMLLWKHTGGPRDDEQPETSSPLTHLA